MKQEINLSDLKVGDMLADSDHREYGCFTNRIVTDIQMTKGGRYHVWESSTYVDKDGKKTIKENYKLFNGPKVASYKMVILK